MSATAKPDRTALGPAYLRLWRRWTVRHWPAILLAFVLAALFALTSAALVKLTVWLVDAFEARDSEAIAGAPLLILGITALRGASLYGQRVLTNRVLATVEADMQREMYAALLAADLARMQAEPPAATAARFTADVGLVRQVMEQIASGVVNVATILGAFAQMLLIDWSLTLGVMAIFLAAIFPITAIGTRLNRIARSTQAQIADMTAGVNEGLSGARLAKTYQLESYLQRAADAAFATLRALKIRAMNLRAAIDPVLEVLGGLAMAALVLFVGTRIAGGTNSLGDFSGFLAGLGIASQPLRKLGNLYGNLMQGLAALERIYGLIDAENHVTDRPGARPLPRVKGEIRLEEVSFAYPDGTPALREVSLDIPAGTRVALVGRSGAGKSTVFNLIPRLYDATRGRVLIDGQDVREVTLASLRSQIALVSQDSVLLTDSVAANIGFGRPGATRAEIEAAARAAAAHDFIAALPQGYETRLGEAGGSFSGGERQRLSIARAILRDAPILLLDEPTSALDAESEAQIRAALDRLTRGRTTLVIAHRLATVQGSDLICAMEAGRIVETGSHDELIARGGLYAELYRLQFQGG
ncbi:MAG: ABC transporter ATP-binding protein [Alphaproteobacteria bacterium]|nr:MAG: ABC transporter ATP-binding protein [Alphaproteobacteria bacterium]